MLSTQIKRNFLIFCFLISGIGCYSQTLNDYRTAVAGNWSIVGNWQRYNGTIWVAAAATPTAATAGVITINHNMTQNINGLSIDQVVMNANLTASINTTIANGTGTDVLINSPFILNLSGGILTNNGSITNAGSITVNATLSNSAGGLITNTGTITISAARTLTNLGTITNSATITNSGSLTFSGGSFYKHNFASSAGVIPTAAWSATSTCEILATAAWTGPTGLNQSFGNFIWNCTTQPTHRNLLGVLNSTVKGDFILQSTNGFELRLDSISNITLPITGNLTLTSGTLVLTNGTGLITMQVAGNYVQSVGANLNMSQSATNSYLTISKDFTHLGGSFGETGSSFNSKVTIGGSAAALTQYIESVGFTSGNNIDFYIQQNGSTTTCCKVATSKTFVVNPGTVFYIVANALNNAATPELTVDGTLETRTLNWIPISFPLIHVNGTFDNYDNGLIFSKTDSTNLFFNALSTYKHNANGGQVPSAKWAVTSNVEVSSGFTTSDSLGNGGQNFGNILWNSTAQTSSASFGTTFTTNPFVVQGNFTVSNTGSGRYRFPDVNFTIWGNLVVQNAAILQLSNAIRLYTPITRTFTISGDINVTGTALLTVGNPNTGGVVGGGDKIRDYVFSLKGDFIHSSSTPIISMIHKSYSGATNDDQYKLTLDFTSGTTQNLSMQTSALNMVTVSGDGAANSGTDDEFNGNNLHKINITTANTRVIGLSDLKYNLLTITATDTLDMTSGTYTLYQYPSVGTTGAALNAITAISANGVMDLGLCIISDATGSGTFNLASIGELKTKHPQGITPVASGAVGCIRTATRTYNAAGYYTYNGSTSQETGTGLPASLSGLLEIDNSTPLAIGGVSLSQATTVSGGASRPLTLTNGKLITTSALLMTVASGTAVTPVGGSATSFVEGPIKKTGMTASTEFIFPTGDNDKWARISVTPTVTLATNAFTAEYIKSDPHAIDTTLNHTVAGRQLNTISYKEHWMLAQSGGTPAAKVKLFWDDGAFSGITLASNTDLRVAHYYNPGTGLKWYAETAVLPVVTGTTTAGTVETAAALTAFSPFTLGSRNSVNPLPVELLTFTGQSTGLGNQLLWTTASETNNDYFDLERSADENFSKVATIAGHGNSASNINYDFLDETPLNGINYYRLKQVDYDGNFKYSNVISIMNDSEDSNVIVYPNPTNDQIQIISSGDIATLEIYNSVGQLVFSRSAENAGIVTFDPLSSGVYLLKATSTSGKIISSRFIRN